MKPSRSPYRGFTLIELLTVIAIISILAALTATLLPRALERAKISKLQGTFQQVRNALVTYYTDHDTYPPAYGYLSPATQGIDPNQLNTHAIFQNEALRFNLKPFMVSIKEFGNTALYDHFAESGDTDRDGVISPLEFTPTGGPNTQNPSFPDQLYVGDNLGGEVQALLDAKQRPFVYIPVNKSQVEKMAQFWRGINAVDPRPRPTDPVSPLAQMRFPPARYDAYVLISVGPAGNTFGLVRNVLPQNYFNTVHPNYRYHALGIAAYFMATRDANNNGELDFDYLARTRQDEGAVRGPNGEFVNQLPDDVAPNGAGPIIYKSS